MIELVSPETLDVDALDHLLGAVRRIAPDQRALIVELGAVGAMTPAGALGLLHLGRRLRRQGLKLLLHLPVAPHAQALLDRIGFFEQARFVFQPYPSHRKPVAAGDVAVRLPLASILSEPDITDAAARLDRSDLAPTLFRLWDSFGRRAPAFMGAWADAGAPLRMAFSVDDTDHTPISARAPAALDGESAAAFDAWLTRHDAQARLLCGLERRGWRAQAPPAAAPLAGLLLEITFAPKKL